MPKTLFNQCCRCWLALLACTAAYSEDAMNKTKEVTLSPVFGSGMILQRDQPIRIWGEASPGAKIVVALPPDRVELRADERGDWSVTLSARGASEEPRQLTVSGPSATRVLEDIRFGDVWLLSGQSNMARGFFTDSGPIVAEAEAFLGTLRDPNLRLLHIDTPASRAPLYSFEAGWFSADYERHAAAMDRFSATGLYFGTQLRREIGVPIGLILAAHGGTRIDNWLPEAALAELRPELLDEPFEGKARHLPAGQFNAKIHPLIPITLRGVLFYQGEGNVGDADYGRLFRRMITEWRTLWKSPRLPFIFAQLANWSDDGAYTPPATGQKRSAKAELREAQREALDLDATTMVPLIDIMHSVPGDERGGFVHPLNKSEIGRRFALAALREFYGHDGLADVPVPVLAESRHGDVWIRFESDNDELALSSGQAPGHFTVAAENGFFHPAEAERVDGLTLRVSSDNIRNPTLVRYAWSDNPTLGADGAVSGSANLVSRTDPSLPVAPFELEVNRPLPDPALYRAELLVAEEFNDLDRWVLEAMDPGDVRVENGELILEIAPARDGLTLWYREPFEAPLLIEFEAIMVGEEGTNDLNHFIMASDPSGGKLFAGSEARGGVFRNYHDLSLYYAGLGVGQNRFHRFRRYPRSGPPNIEIAAENAGRSGLLESGVPMRIQIVVEKGGRVRLWKDGQRLFDFREDGLSHPRGHFGFRSYNSHIRIKKFKAWRIGSTTAPSSPPSSQHP